MVPIGGCDDFDLQETGWLGFEGGEGRQRGLERECPCATDAIN